MTSQDGEADNAVDPEEFLRALLKISPEDAEKVREQAGTSADPQDGPQEGPVHDYDEEQDKRPRNQT
jgi:hypothetical protein